MAHTMRRRVKLRSRKPVEEPEIIVIPMIDVMMFLLFFFMVASLAMVVQNAIPVQLPKASTAQQENVERITITLKPEGTIYLNTRVTTIANLQKDLEALHVGPKTSITLNADERVPYGSVVAVMDEGRKAGVPAFAFAISRH